MTVHSPILVLTLISAVIAATIGIGAAFLYGFNGKFMRAIAQMLFCIATEICIAMIANFYIDNPIVFASIKIGGRIVEAVGVLVFIRSLIRARKEPSETIRSGEMPPEHWEGRFDRLERLILENVKGN